MKKLLILLGFILLLSCKEDEDLLCTDIKVNDPYVELEGIMDSSLIVEQDPECTDALLKSY